MLRGTRGLLLLAIVLIVGAVAASYFTLKRTQAHQAPPRPRSLPTNTDAAAQSWVWRKDEATHGIVEVRARRFQRLNAPDVVEIEGVEVLIYKEGGQQYDDIRSARARFDESREQLYSEGEVEITMGLPASGPPSARPLQIRTSGVTYEAKSGKAYTDRPAAFSFEQGDGQCVGALYDPNIRVLTMRSQVELNWRGRDPSRPAMKIEAGELVYREQDAVVLLGPWSRLKRDTLTIEAGESRVELKEGAIDKVNAEKAHGTDRQPGRDLEYSANHLFLQMGPENAIQLIRAGTQARLVSTSDSARTTVTADRLDLDFELGSGESELRQATTFGHGVVEAVPAPRAGVEPAETRVLRSDNIVLKMRGGGKDIERVETHSPAHVEFLPNGPAQHHRTLEANPLEIDYGPGNIIRQFRGRNAATRTDPLPPKPNEKAKKGDAAAPSLTWSRELKADFDDKGQLTRLEQWDNFRYEEGERRARAQRAVLEQASDRITLEREARIWDASGATSGDRVVMDQKSGDVEAEGRVVSTRMPDQKGKSSAMLSNDQPLQAQADRMRTAERNRKVHYEGHAVAWQGANRIWGNAIDIDRAGRLLTATGNVRTQFLEQQRDQPAADGAKAAAGAKPAAERAPGVVTIDAAAMRYTEAERVAYYTGGVHLARPGMDVKSSELRAWLNDRNAETSLNHAFADGEVAIVRTQPDRTLNGQGAHAEYYTAAGKDQERILLTGADATLVDSARGVTKGRELTYYTNLDKLLVNGMAKDPVITRMRRRGR
jgi:lipopolysaccharide export system protein LptA